MKKRPSDSEVRNLRDQFLKREASRPMGIQWLSFCDPDREPGDKFLGVVVVRERGFVSAQSFIMKIGLNPGGEVFGYEIAMEKKYEKILEGHWNRLLSKDEANELSERLKAA